MRFSYKSEGKLVFKAEIILFIIPRFNTWPQTGWENYAYLPSRWVQQWEKDLAGFNYVSVRV